MLLQGNTYELPIQVRSKNGKIITDFNLSKAQFIFNGIEKFYGENGVVAFDDSKKAFIVPLTEQETFRLSGNIKWQVRFLFADGKVSGTKPKIENVLSSITKTILGGDTDVV